jgi:EAL and modified HD-GYP domain-containing signal transduction protein
MFLYAARQPILDIHKNLFAYELLFRDSLENVFPDIDADEATSKLIENQLNIGIEDFTDDKPAFINFTLDTLLKKYPTLIHQDHIVVEILETVQPGKRLLNECKALKQQGYIIALDDYIHQPQWRHFYPFIDIIKIDFKDTSFEQMAIIKIAIKDFPQIKLLAEKVETIDEFEKALELGFCYFQGYFFAKPEVIQSKALSPAQLTLADLLIETTKAEIDIGKITRVFERDVNLAYKLLRYSNSAIFKRRAEVANIKQAIVVLGQKELKKFLSILFAAQVGSDKPAELMRLSMTRARFAELIAQAHGQDPSKAFLTGMMSLIDALLDESIESVMKKLPLSQEIKGALINHKGILASYLAIVKYFEVGNWSSAEKNVSRLGLEQSQVAEFKNQAAQWADQQMKAFGE